MRNLDGASRPRLLRGHLPTGGAYCPFVLVRRDYDLRRVIAEAMRSFANCPNKARQPNPKPPT